MATILVVDDDPTLRMLVTLHLESDGHDVVSAGDGLEGLNKAVTMSPDVVVTDYRMPNFDGIAMLAALRANQRTESIPVIFLTGEATHAVEAKANEFGAAHFLLKPFDRSQLLDAVAQQLRLQAAAPMHRISANPAMGTNVMADGALEGTARMALLGVPVHPAVPVDEADRNVAGTVLFFDIRNFTTISEELDAQETVALLNHYFAKASVHIQNSAGWIVKFSGDGMIAMFEGSDAAGQSHALRAMKAAMFLVMDARQMGPWIANQFPGRPLPPFAVGAGLHSGIVSVCRIAGTGQSGSHTVIGDTVNIASRLENQTKELGWSIVASRACFALAGERIHAGRQGQIAVKGRAQAIDIVEVLGLNPRPGVHPDQTAVYPAIEEAIHANAEVMRASQAQSANHSFALARPVTASWPKTTGSGFTGNANAAISIPGYRLIRKLGEGGMSEVFLAAHEESGEEQVLKVVRLTHADDGDDVQRFMHEYAYLSQISHPNVARIYAQGFAGEHAYMSMEYFPGGDLRAMLQHSNPPELAIATLLQVADGLSAVHRANVVHRDLKPDNIMLRANGSLAIADFGIAREVSADLGLTQRGTFLGTPFYMSPEQSGGLAADLRSDIYSLGVMFYEMLTGERAYDAETPQEMLEKHISAPVPMLPAGLLRYQPLLDLMMHKQIDKRFAKASHITKFILSSHLA